MKKLFVTILLMDSALILSYQQSFIVPMLCVGNAFATLLRCEAGRRASMDGFPRGAWEPEASLIPELL